MNVYSGCWIQTANYPNANVHAIFREEQSGWPHSNREIEEKNMQIEIFQKKEKRKFYIWIVNEEKALKGKMQNELKAGARNPISNVWGECDKCNLSFIPSETFSGNLKKKRERKTTAGKYNYELSQSV